MMNFPRIILIGALATALPVKASDWRFISISQSERDGEIVNFIDLDSIKNDNGKFEVWIETIRRSDIEAAEASLKNPSSMINEKLKEGYLVYGYALDSAYLKRIVDREVNAQFAGLAPTKKETALIQDMIVRSALLDELTVNKYKIRSVAKILYEINPGKMTLRVLDFIGPDGRPESIQYNESHIPPDSGMETVVKILKFKKKNHQGAA